MRFLNSVWNVVRDTKPESLLTASIDGHTPVGPDFADRLQGTVREKGNGGTVRLFDITELFGSYRPEPNMDTRFTPFCMLRLFADLVPEIPDKILYLDTDVLCRAPFDDMYDPETNIRYGCWYLGNLSRIFDGDPIEMACAYHAGPNNVKLWIMNYAADQKNLRLEEVPMQDTRQYAGKVYDAYAIYFQHDYPDPV